MTQHGLPVSLVEKHNERTNVQKARRIPGEWLESGSIQLKPTLGASRVEPGEQDRPTAEAAAAWLNEGFRYLEAYSSHPAVSFPYESVQNHSPRLTAAWMKNHHVLVDVITGEGNPVIRVDTSWVEPFQATVSQGKLAAADPADTQGLSVLSALAWVHVFATLKGDSSRDALHTVLDLASELPEADLECLHRALGGRVLDSNNAFSLFLRGVQDARAARELEGLDLDLFRGIRTRVLLEAGNQLEREGFASRRLGNESSMDLSASLLKLAGTRDGLRIEEREIDKLLSRIQSLPGLNGHAAAPVIQLIEKTVKWRDKWVTWMLGQQRVDMPYDQTRVIRLLDEDIADVDEKRALINEAVSTTYDLEIEGGNILRLSSWARQSGMRMVAGRLSRAFGNQAHLLSAAQVLADKEGMLPSVKRLHEASMGVSALQTQATRLLHLIQQRKPTPYAQTIGALNAYEEALFEYQSKEFQRMLREKDEASRRPIGRHGADVCGPVLDGIQSRIRNLYQVAAEFRDQLELSKKDPAAFIIYLQRLHPAETINLANANLLREVHPGKEEDLRDLTRQGGHFTYSSPGLGRIPQGHNGPDRGGDTHWIIQVDDWIEAIPLFIHERVVKRTIQLGGEETTVELIETEVDQDAMEVFFRLHAEFWARNIEAVMDSEHVGLARRLLVQGDPEWRAAMEEFRRANPDKPEDEAALFVTQQHSELTEGLVALGALVGAAYRDKIEEISRMVEMEDIPRITAVENAIRQDKGLDVAKALKKGNAVAVLKEAVRKAGGREDSLKQEAARMKPWAGLPARKVPSLHILTTESAGMTEGYVQTWIEEEMALYNVVRREGLEGEVQQRMGEFRARVQSVARQVIAEFGMSVVIDEVMAQQRLPEPAAVMTVLTSFKPVMEEAAKLAVLIEMDEARSKKKPRFDRADDPKEVEEYLKKHRARLMKTAVAKVAENNGKAFEKRVEEIRAEHKKLDLFEAQKKAIQSEADYREEFEAVMRFEARAGVLEDLDRRYPERRVFEQVRTYIRTHTALAKSTARKEVIARRQLNQLAMHPLYYYQAAGGNKRYNLLYTPSRVNLGERERDSVVKWRQWVGGADRWAARAGFEFYSLINEGGVEERPALAYAEIQKTSENALCVTHFAGSNALALLCMAVLEGDAEDMADQMNLRQDRLIPPAGEGYGGYCVPKDGLFLAFVLSLQNEVKLRQMGIPERYHEGVMKMAKEVLLHQNDFESHFAWQRWAAEKLLVYKQLKKYFDLDGEILVFHITKIARAVENLGQPWHETTHGSKLVANLAARWGVDKMIIRAEQVNRFMVFYKAWMIYDALREAREENPNCPAEDEAVVALSAEYKPVQDVRYSTGMRLFELLARTGDHLYHSLDEEGQNLAYLMFHGFDPDTQDPRGRRVIRELYQQLNISKDNPEIQARLREAFPPHRSPGDIVMTSVTLSSTQDMLFYTSDTRLDEIASQVQVILGDYGLTEDQIRANATVYGGRLRQWAGIKQLPKEEQDELIARVDGRIHALVLKMRGPGRGYEKDIQGIDVLNTGIPFPELLRLVDDMPKVVALMRNGNPHSALAITDGTAGRARRALTYRDVQLFFAACEQIGRQGIYRAVGLGKRNIDRLREEMRRKRERAERLFQAVAAVAKAADETRREQALAEALNQYQYLRENITVAEEAVAALREEEKMKRYKKWKKRDYYISQALAKISAGLPLARLDFGLWLAGIGGVYAVTGEPEAEIQKRVALWNEGLEIIARQADPREAEGVNGFTAAEQADLYKHLVRPEYVPETQRFAQQMLVESSSKAVEIAAREALERRKALKIRAERARAFNDREDGFRESFKEGEIPAFDPIWNEAQKCLASIQSGLDVIYSLKGTEAKWTETQSQINRDFGRFIGLTRSGLTRLFLDILPEDNAGQRSLKKQALTDLATVYTGREIILEDLKKLIGGYEDIGAVARLAEAANGNREQLEAIARGIELLYITFALAQTLEFVLVPAEDVDPALLWKNVVDFFAETINDHWFNYWPWAYSRGVGFQDMPDDDKYRLAVERHAWLYDYFRALYIHRTELRGWSARDRDALLGNFSGKNQIVAIGAGGFTEDMIRWRAYNQLRELAFLKSDGFEFPPVFHEFDPDLIEADKRVNVAFLFPIGRTHVSRALREGPTLNQQLQSEKRPGANLLITRHGRFVEVEGAKRKVLLVDDAHFYISEAEFAEALKQLKLKKPEIKERIQQEKAAGRLTPKGIRVAARFVKNGRPSPVAVGGLVPFHGLPIYVNGQSEAEGMPATIQSQVYTDITYDKSLYPRIYTPETGVQLPPEIDWLNEWNEDLDADSILQRIAEGYPEKRFPGLRTFALEHPIILIKGAAESGARNLKVFEVQDDHARVREDGLKETARFVYDVSRGQNVVIQAAVFTNPELWASPELMESFVERQILEWNTPVNRDSYPRSQIYGSMRIVTCSSHPKRKYETAFPISLMSLQVATNVGRGGTLEPLREEHIRKPFRKMILEGLRAEGPKVMEALNRYVKKYGAEWEAHTGKTIGQDLRGVSYGWANYLMCDYVITPVFKRRGRLVDILPVFDENGRRVGSKPILQDETGRFEGEIVDWRFIHLEPNVGIGLWDRYNLREEANERISSQREGRPFDWNRVGQGDRVVLRSYVLGGEEYLKANFGKKGIQRAKIEKAVEK
ncbi:MAG: hypothetical protein ACE15F_10815 [bacterium]